MNHRAFEWWVPVAVTFGEGCADSLAVELDERGAVVLSFAPARRLGAHARLSEPLGRRLLAWIDVPDGMATLSVARALSRDVWPLLERDPTAVVVGVGGGSVLDMAKLLRCRAHVDDGFDALVAALRGRAPWPALQLAPLWLVPTTAGTGSEVTRWATLWDTDDELAVKRSFDEPFGFADRAFVDPTLAVSCSLDVTRDAALDALAHALESIWNHHANPVSDSLAVSAARRIIAMLPLVLEAPQRLERRRELSLAALEAGLAFSQTRTALAHALSYELTLEQGMPHGRACALWLPTAWRMAVGRDARIDALLSRVFDWDASEGAAMLASWLEHVGASSEPEQAGIGDVQARVTRALASSRGRNFVAAG